MPTKNRSVEQLVEEQLQKWNLRGTERKTRSVRPGASITVSREPGCGGTEIAKRLAGELGMDLFGILEPFKGWAAKWTKALNDGK